MTNKFRNKPLVYTVIFALLISVCFTLLAGCRPGPEIPGTSDSGKTTPSPITSSPDTTTSYKEKDTTTADATTPDQTTPGSSSVTDTQPATPEDTTTAKTPETTVLPAPIASSGTFKMDTGTTLGYRVDWSLDKFEDGLAYIDVKVILTTYELYVSARRNLGIINFGEDSIRFSTDRISYSGKKPTEIILTFVQVVVPATGDIAVAYIEGEWFFNASYAGTEYDWLSAGGYVCVQKPQ